MDSVYDGTDYHQLLMPVTAANAIDQVVVRFIMDRGSMSISGHAKAVITYLQSHQASEYQPRTQNTAGQSKPIELFHGKPVAKMPRIGCPLLRSILILRMRKDQCP